MEAKAAAVSWLGHRVLSAWIVTVLALFLGLLSVALVAELANQCRDEPSYLLSIGGSRILLADGSGYILLAEGKHRTCRLRLSW